MHFKYCTLYFRIVVWSAPFCLFVHVDEIPHIRRRDGQPHTKRSITKFTSFRFKQSSCHMNLLELSSKIKTRKNTNGVFWARFAIVSGWLFKRAVRETYLIFNPRTSQPKGGMLFITSRRKSSPLFSFLPLFCFLLSVYERACVCVYVWNSSSRLDT